MEEYVEALDDLIDLLNDMDLEILDKMEELEELRVKIDNSSHLYLKLYEALDYYTIEAYCAKIKIDVNLTATRVVEIIKKACGVCQDYAVVERCVPISGRGLHYIFPDYILDKALQELGIIPFRDDDDDDNS